MKEYLKWIILGCAFVIPFIVFNVSHSMFFPYIAGKNFAFRAVVEIMFGAWLVLAYLDAQYRPKISYLTITVTSLLVIVGLADVFGVNLEKSLWSNYERMEGYVTIVHLFMYFLVMGSVFADKRLWYRLFNTMIISSVILAFIGFREVFSEEYAGGRLKSTLGNEIYLAVYMLVHMFLTAYMLFRDSIKQWTPRHYLYIVAIILQFVILYFTYTRGTLLGLVGGISMITILIAIFEKRNKLLKNVAIGFVGTVVVLVGLFLEYRTSDFVQSQPILARFANIQLTNETGQIEDRFLIWGMAYEGFQERPILGWGQGNFPYVFSKYYDTRLFDAEPWFDRAHNVFMDWLISAGILGLLSYLSIYIAALYLLWRRKDDDFSFISKVIFTGLFNGYFIHNIFVFDNLVSYILFFTILAYIHTRSVHVHENMFQKAHGVIHKIFGGVSKKEHEATIAALIGVATVFAVYFVNYPGYAQNKLIISALRVPPEQAERSLDLYKQALAYDSFGNAETRERLIFQAQQLYRNESIPVDVRTQYMDLAIEEANKQIEAMPGDSKYPLFTSGLYLAKGDYASAIDMLEKTREIAPKKDILLMALGDTYVNAGNMQKALETYKEIFDEQPRNTKAAVRYAYVALIMGNEDLASEILTPIYGTYLIPDPIIVNVYSSQDRFDVVRDIYINAIETDPTKPEYRFQLAGAYIKLGETDLAIETLQQAKADFPDNAGVQNDAVRYIGEFQAQKAE
jgi:O-antigen ligase/tetratricopeptide (TPR) repeat protein